MARRGRISASAARWVAKTIECRCGARRADVRFNGHTLVCGACESYRDVRPLAADHPVRVAYLEALDEAQALVRCGCRHPEACSKCMAYVPTSIRVALRTAGGLQPLPGGRA